MQFFKSLYLFLITAILLTIAPSVRAEMQCPTGWVKEVRDSVIVCVAQNQQQAQSQVQNNNQNQNVNQKVTTNGGSSSSSSSSSSSYDVTINNPAPHPVYVPTVVYKTPSYIKSLPATGLPETAAAAGVILPLAGLVMRKLAFKNTDVKEDESALSTWLRKNSL